MISWKTLVLMACAACAGWFAHAPNTVHAVESGPAAGVFQLQGAGPEAQLAIYDSVSRTISVYQGVGSGSDVKSCSYQYQLGRSGASIRRVPCAIGTLP